MLLLHKLLAVGRATRQKSRKKLSVHSSIFGYIMLDQDTLLSLIFSFGGVYPRRVVLCAVFLCYLTLNLGLRRLASYS